MTKTTAMQRPAGWSIAIGVLMILGGLAAIGLPMLAGLAVSTVVAWMLVFGGACHLGFAWTARSAGAGLWQVLIGFLYGGVGIYMLLHVTSGLFTLTLLLASYLVVEGMLELLLASLVAPMPGRRWLFVDGGVTLLLGALIWKWWPADTSWVLGTMVGISIVSSGVARLLLTAALRDGKRAEHSAGGDRPIETPNAAAR